MARFVVLDHSLTRVGGHHYEQATLILRAVDAMGHDSVLVTNRRFSQQHLLPPHWRVLALFPDESYDCQDQYPLNVEGELLGSWSVDLQSEPEGLVRPAWWRVRPWLAQWQRRRRIMRFAAACTRMDEAIGLRDGDHVFIPTTSLFDLLGLVRYLQTRAAPIAVVWHVCFHYGFLQGREPRYAAQAAQQEKIRQQLQYLVQHLPGGQLRFYATTDKLAHQFNRLGVARFSVLPFPVDYGALQRVPLPRPRSPLRLTCAGFLRREKGKMWASRLVQGLWDTELVPGHVQLVVQTNQRQARRMLPRGEAVKARFRADLRDMAAAEPIVWLRHPLKRDAYLELIRESDIALFLHDGCAYYTRCSGVLVEMLAAGVPVLVPAGSWLAEQVAEPIRAHLAALAAHATCLAPGSPHELLWQYPDGRPCVTQHETELIVGGASRAASCEIPVPRIASALLVSFQWHGDRGAGAGTYLRVCANQLGAAVPTINILSPSMADDCAWALIHLDQGVPDDGRRGDLHLHLHLKNAFDDSLIAIRTIQVSFLERSAEQSGSYPAGSVGLVFADVEQLPILVRNLREHYPHYRQTALQFAHQWRHRHDARRIVTSLLQDRETLKAVA